MAILRLEERTKIVQAWEEPWLVIQICRIILQVKTETKQILTDLQSQRQISTDTWTKTMQLQKKLTTPWTVYILMKHMIKEVESSTKMECILCGNPNSPPSDSSTMKADRSLVRFQGLSLILLVMVQVSCWAILQPTKEDTIISLVIITTISSESSMTPKLPATLSLSMICVSVILI